MKKPSKSISHTNIGFPFKTYMELGTRFFEDKAPEFFKKAKKKRIFKVENEQSLEQTR